MDSIFPSGLVCRVLAQASASPQQAESYLEEGLKLFAAGEAHTEAARTRVIYGDLLAARGESAAAYAQWQSAADVFAAGGFEHDLADLNTRLA